MTVADFTTVIAASTRHILESTEHAYGSSNNPLCSHTWTWNMQFNFDLCESRRALPIEGLCKGNKNTFKLLPWSSFGLLFLIGLGYKQRHLQHWISGRLFPLLVRGPYPPQNHQSSSLTYGSPGQDFLRHLLVSDKKWCKSAQFHLCFSGSTEKPFDVRRWQSDEGAGIRQWKS